MNANRSMQFGQTSPGRVVTLTFLSRTLPASSFTEPLAQSLHTDTGTSVALIRFVEANYHADLKTQSPVNVMVEDDIQTMPLLFTADVGFHRVNLSISNGPHPPGWVASLLEQLRRRFDYILIEASTEELSAASL